MLYRCLPFAFVFMGCVALSPSMAMAFQVTWQGVVKGADGRPLPKSQLVLKRGIAGVTIARVISDKNGRFMLKAQSKGFIKLSIKGPNHDGKYLPFYIKHKQR